jgi:hypothetical protein
MDNIQKYKILSAWIYIDGLIILTSCRAKLQFQNGGTGWIRLSDIFRGVSIIVLVRYLLRSQQEIAP